MKTNRIFFGLRCGMLAGSLLFAALAGCEREVEEAVPAASDSDRVVLYTSLQEWRAGEIVFAYPDESGVAIHHMLGSPTELIGKMVAKEHYPGPDVLLVAGAGAVAQAVDEDVLRPLRLLALDEISAPPYRDPDGYWVAVGVRAEAIVFDERTVDAAKITGYHSLADDVWAGKLCLAGATSQRTHTLVASMIAQLGERNAELAVRGWRDNLATGVFDSQEDLLEALDGEQCAIGIVSSEVLARFNALNGDNNLGFVFPSAEAGGTRFDVLAAGVSRHANDAEAATEFIRWLLSDAGQRALHGGDFEFSIAGPEGVRPPLLDWPGFVESPVAVSRAGELHPDAVLLLERARIR